MIGGKLDNVMKASRPYDDMKASITSAFLVDNKIILEYEGKKYANTIDDGLKFVVQNGSVELRMTQTLFDDGMVIRATFTYEYDYNGDYIVYSISLVPVRCRQTPS